MNIPDIVPSHLVGVVHAKGSSTRVPNKNCQKIWAKPLFIWALEKLRSVGIKDVYLDSDSSAMRSQASQAGFLVFERDSSLATNQTNGHELLLNFAKSVPAEGYLQLACTAPFIATRTLKKMIRSWNSEKRDSFLVRRHQIYKWEEQGDSILPDYDVKGLPNSFELPSAFEEVTAAYLVGSDSLFEERARVTRKSIAISVGAIESLDVNSLEDLLIVQAVAQEAPEFLVTGPFTSEEAQEWDVLLDKSHDK